MEYRVKIHHTEPARAGGMACLNPLPALPEDGEFSPLCAPYQVALIERAASGGWKWATWERTSPNWREILGAALQQAAVTPGTWHWITLHEETAHARKATDPLAHLRA